MSLFTGMARAAHASLGPQMVHINTTFPTQIYIRWCCIDLSNAPRLSGLTSEPTGKLNTAGMEKASLRVTPDNLGNVLRQQLFKSLLLFSILKYSLRNHRELTRPVVEHVGMLIDKGS